MKLIRKSVFETNSSSCHSLSISYGDVLNSITPDYDNSIKIPAMSFGWEIERYKYPLDKLAYIYIYIRDWCHGPIQELFTDILWEVVCKHTGATSLVYMGDENEGFIDHQSVEDNNLDYLFEDKELLKQFIFNPDSILYTDNDNH